MFQSLMYIQCFFLSFFFSSMNFHHVHALEQLVIPICYYVEYTILYQNAESSTIKKYMFTIQAKPCIQ